MCCVIIILNKQVWCFCYIVVELEVAVVVGSSPGYLCRPAIVQALRWLTQCDRSPRTPAYRKASDTAWTYYYKHCVHAALIPSITNKAPLRLRIVSTALSRPAMITFERSYLCFPLLTMTFHWRLLLGILPYNFNWCVQIRLSLYISTEPAAALLCQEPARRYFASVPSHATFLQVF